MKAKTITVTVEGIGEGKIEGQARTLTIPIDPMAWRHLGDAWIGREITRALGEWAAVEGVPEVGQ